MNSRTRTLTGLLAAAALVVAGCGGSTDAGSSSTGSSSGGSGTGTSAAGCDTSGTSAAAESATADLSSGESSVAGAAPAATSAALPAAGVTLDGPLKIGSAGFQESALIAEIYAGALEAKGVKVEKTLNIGQRETYYKGLLDGSIDLIPDYTGNLLGFADKTATATDEADVYAALPAALAPDGLVVLDESKAEDKDSLTVTKDTADKYNLKTIDDLAKVACTLTFGGPPEFQTRSYGLPGLKAKYGITFKDFVELDSGGPLSANGLKNGQVDVTDLFTTDPSIPENNFVVLEDTKNNWAAQVVVPLIKADKATEKVRDALNAVQAKLTTEGLTALLKRVYSNESAETVAKDWLSENGLS